MDVLVEDLVPALIDGELVYQHKATKEKIIRFADLTTHQSEIGFEQRPDGPLLSIPDALLYRPNPFLANPDGDPA